MSLYTQQGSASYNALRFRQTNTHWIYMPWYVFVLLAVQWIFKLNKSMLLLSIARGQFKNKDNDSKKTCQGVKTENINIIVFEWFRP